MSLNGDIIRDTLLCIDRKCDFSTSDEGHFVYKQHIPWRSIYEDETLNKSYLVDDIKLCINKLLEAKLIDANIPGRKDKISLMFINGITWEGYELINNIRDNDVWSAVKTKLGSFAKVSFSAIAESIKGYTISTIKNKLGLN